MSDAEVSWGPDDILRHTEFVQRLAFGLVRGASEADDVVQEVLNVAIQRPPRDGSHPRAWLAGVTRNVVRNRRRSEARRRRREDAAARTEAVPGPDEITERLELQRLVLGMAAGLAEPYKTTLFLRYFEDLTPTEIAVRLGEPVATVKTRLRRSLEQIRGALDKRHGGDRAAWHAAFAPLLARGGLAALAAGGVWLFTAWRVAVLVGVVLLVAIGFTPAVRRVLSGSSDDARSASASAETKDVEQSGPTLAATPAGPRAPGTEVVRDPAALRPIEVKVEFVGVPPRTVEIFASTMLGKPPTKATSERGESVTLLIEPLIPGTGSQSQPRQSVTLWGHADGDVVCLGDQSLLWVSPLPPALIRVFPARRVEGEVVDLATGEPVAHAAIQAVVSGRFVPHTAPYWRAASDNRGRCSLLVPTDLQSMTRIRFPPQLRIIANARGFQAAEYGLENSSTNADAPLTIRLSKGASIVGVVRDSDGNAVANALVAVEPVAPASVSARPFYGTTGDLGVAPVDRTLVLHASGFSFPPLGEPVAFWSASGPRGEYRVDGLTLGAHYHVSAFEPTHTDRPAADLFIPAGANVVPHDFTFERPGAVRLRLTDAEGHPILTTKVSCAGGSSAARIVGDEVVIDATTPGTQVFSVVYLRADQGLPDELTIDVPRGGTVSVSAVLGSGHAIEGIAVDDNGQPVNGGCGTLRLAGTGPEIQLYADDTGQFRLKGLVAGRYILEGDTPTSRVEDPTFLPWRREITIPGPPLRIRTGSDPAARRMTLELRIPDSGTAAPTRVDLDVRATSSTELSDRFHRMWLTEVHPSGGRGLSRGWDARWNGGLFDFVVRPEETLLVVRASGFAPVAASLQHVETSLTRQLSAGVAVVLTVVDENGRPIENAIVALDQWFDTGEGKASTRADGTVRFENAVSGPTRVYVVARGFASARRDLQLDEAHTEFTTHLEAGVAVHGRVVGSSGLPEPLGAGEPVRVTRIDRQGGTESIDSLRVDPRGQFEGHLLPGRYRFTVEHRDMRAESDVLDVEQPLDVVLDLKPR